MEEMSKVFSFTFFFTAAHFHLALVAASISHFVTVATKFSSCSSSCSPLFRWRLSFAGLPPIFSFSLSFSSSIFQICGHDDTDTETISAFRVFVLIDSLVVFGLQDAGGYAISLQNNLELHLGCYTC